MKIYLFTSFSKKLKTFIMENSEGTFQEKTGLVFDDKTTAYVESTAKWGLFLAIMGYIGVGLMVLASIVMLAIRDTLASAYERPGISWISHYLYLIYLVLAVVYFFPVHFLYKFSSKAKAGLRSDDQNTLNNGFLNLKRLYQFSGIMLIVVLSLYVVGIVIALAISALH